jgi:aminobenzoyl-glutamate transport protein
MATVEPQRGWLGRVERVGNALPDPVFLFFYLILGLVALSAVIAAVGWSAVHPTTGETIAAQSLLSADNLRKLFVDMPTTFTHFHPLGYVLTVMLGAGVAERTGLFSAAMRIAVKDAPKGLLTPVIAFVAMMGNLAADAAYVVLIPLAGVIFAAAGRHPIAGICAAFAGVSGGFSANLLPGQLDALLFGITEAAAETLNPKWDANIAGNWYFISAMLVVFLPVIWFVTDRVVEPRLGTWTESKEGDSTTGVSQDERRGLVRAGWVALLVIVAWTLLTVLPGAPFIDPNATPEARLSPFYKSLVAGFLVLFLATGWVYGAAAGSVKGHRDIAKMMAASMADLGYYLVLAFVAAHFVSMFNWSNLGLLIAVSGAQGLSAMSLPTPLLLALIVVLTALINLFIGSASAKWALLAPVLVPMLMLLGISPEMTTAAYRMGDSTTNIITPLMVYFPLILTFCQRWNPSYGLGSLMASMLPYSMGLLAVGVLLVVAWAIFGAPLGPDAGMFYAAP